MWCVLIWIQCVLSFRFLHLYFRKNKNLRIICRLQLCLCICLLDSKPLSSQHTNRACYKTIHHLGSRPSAWRCLQKRRIKMERNSAKYSNVVLYSISHKLWNMVCSVLFLFCFVLILCYVVSCKYLENLTMICSTGIIILSNLFQQDSPILIWEIFMY